MNHPTKDSFRVREKKVFRGNEGENIEKSTLYDEVLP